LQRRRGGFGTQDDSLRINRAALKTRQTSEGLMDQFKEVKRKYMGNLIKPAGKPNKEKSSENKNFQTAG